MSKRTPRESFVRRHLDPASRLGEILFGLIMVLTATLTAGLTVREGRAGVLQLLQSAIGCNIAWGIIDGIMYVMNCLVERSGRARLIAAVQRAPDRASALAAVRREVDTTLESIGGSKDHEAVCEAALEHLLHASPKRSRVTKDDLFGAIGCFWLVFLSCLPAALPFLIFNDPTRALRVSNLLLMVMLFVVGQKWAQYASTNRLVAGLAMVGIGLALVGVAVALGG